MNEQDQRIAIAKALGELNPRDDGNGGVIASSWCHRGVYGGTHGVPDYLRDLNAMHEAEKTLTESQHESYWRNLIKVCIDPENNNRSWIHLATAKQRAEAFLLALNLWKP
jgi:hypothetical protein